MKHIDRWFATTNRLRTEGTDHLLAAAEAAGVSHFVGAQSYANWNGIRKGGWVKTEEDPLDPEICLARLTFRRFRVSICGRPVRRVGYD